MLIRIGTIYLGKVHEVNGQCVETKFFMLGFPLFPTQSVWKISAGRGLPIPLHGTSVIAAYGRIYTCMLAAIFIVIAVAAGGSPVMLVIGLLFLAGWAYLMFAFGQPDSAEIAQRNKLGKLTGLYARPEWLDEEHAYNVYEQTDKKYKLAFNNSDWMEDLQSNSPIPKEKLPFLFLLSCMSYRLGATPENGQLFKKADELYQPVTDKPVV